MRGRAAASDHGRAPCSVARGLRPGVVPVSYRRLRYTKATGTWALYRRDRNLRFHASDLLNSSVVASRLLRPGGVMTDYSTLLGDHVTLTCRSIDRIFLQAYVPKLQTVGWVCQYLRWQRGYPIPSSAAFGKIGAGYVAEVHRFAAAHGIPVRHFAKGENKGKVARPLIDQAAAEGGQGRVVLIGIAQEKAPVWRSWKAKGQEHLPHPHMEWGRQMAFVNHFYFSSGSPCGTSADPAWL